MNPARWIAVRVPTVLLARRNLSRANARTILAISAIVIGVVAIGAIGTGGEAFKQSQLAAYEGFGGTATVDPVFDPEQPEPGDRTFSDREIAQMRQVTEGASILPVVESFGPLVRTETGEVIPNPFVQWIGNPGTFYDAQAGSIPENWDRTVVVGSRLATDNGIVPGDRITIRVDGELDRSFRVAAVLEPQGFADPLNADRSIFVPLTQYDGDEYDGAIVKVTPQTGSIETAAARIDSAFNTRRRTVEVETVQQQREQFEQLFATVNQFLIGVGAISLLVAAVTIANTMLMSVIEREGEIGLLRAVGYPKTAVMSILVAESTILGVFGGLLGAPLALGIGLVINQLLLGEPLAFTALGLRYVAFAVGVGMLTALLAGLYPAWTAANKRPVEALDS